MLPTPRPRARSPRAGGCTFPEDPGQGCASVRPLWSADVDPRVLRVSALPGIDAAARVFMGLPPGTRRLLAGAVEHLLIEHDGVPVRLDVVEGTVASGPFTFRFDLPDDDRLEERLATIRIFRGGPPRNRLHLGLARRLLALLAVDARDAGASLREVAEQVLGPGDWPGDGEHRKSAARRLIGTGARMLREGPRAVLAGRAGPPR